MTDSADSEMKRIEQLTPEELDAELRSYGYDPNDLNWKMLKRLLEEQDKGVDTPMLREAIRQFREAVK